MNNLRRNERKEKKVMHMGRKAKNGYWKVKKKLAEGLNSHNQMEFLRRLRARGYRRNRQRKPREGSEGEGLSRRHGVSSSGKTTGMTTRTRNPSPTLRRPSDGGGERTSRHNKIRYRWHTAKHFKNLSKSTEIFLR